MNPVDEKKIKLLFVVNDGNYFISHRLSLAKAAQKEGYEIHVAVPEGPSKASILAEGFYLHPIVLKRKNINVFHEIKTFFGLLKLFKQLRPDLMHLITIKPVMLGGIAARLAKIQSVAYLLPGLGYVFTKNSISTFSLRKLVKLFYRLSFQHENCQLIVQNASDLSLVVDTKLIQSHKVTLISGSGVDIRKFTPSNEPEGIPVVVLASRMLKNKGVVEYVQAAQLLKKEKNIQARFVLVGETDSGNPSHIPLEQLKQWQEEGFIEWWGKRDDMVEVFRGAHIVCLPSYREGLPKVLLEAAACAKPIVTTDVPGCRDIVTHGKNGYLVEAKNAKQLAEALKRLIDNSILRINMGKFGRMIVEEGFSDERINRETLLVYKNLRTMAAKRV